MKLTQGELFESVTQFERTHASNNTKNTLNYNCWMPSEKKYILWNSFEMTVDFSLPSKSSLSRTIFQDNL